MIKYTNQNKMVIEQKLNTYNLSSSKDNIFSIQPSFLAANYEEESFLTYTHCIKQLIIKIMPKEIFQEAILNPTPKNIEQAFLQFDKKVPIFHYSLPNKARNTLSLVILCFGDYTHGLGRFIPDMLSRWIVPGSQLPIEGHRALNFRFPHFPKYRYYIAEFFIRLSNQKECDLIKKNIPSFIHEMRLNILAVYHARCTLSKRTLSLEEKSAMIKENISLLLGIPLKENIYSAYDQMQNFLIKLSAEKKLSEIKKNIERLMMHDQPKTFDRDIYDSIYNISLLLGDKFTAQRNPRHVSSIIAFQYLFKKAIQQNIFHNSTERYLNLKFLKTRLIDNTSVIGVLISTNFIHETEQLEKKEIVDALKASISNIEVIKDSYITDKRDEKIRSFYLEIKKTDNNFSTKEITGLKKNLPHELKIRIQNMINPIFKPQNEEETIRNTILLSNQLKYVKDIPQAIISYNRQSGKDISFTVILVRLVHARTISLKEYFKTTKTFLRFSNNEIKKVGFLRKYPKEVNVFKLSLNKSPFFRQDNSLDLHKATYAVTTELKRVIGDFRDFNGGMLLKQSQALDKFKKLVSDIAQNQDLLLENFFYSLKPATMQSIIPLEILKALFLMNLQVSQQNFNIFTLKTKMMDKYFLVLIGATSPEYVEETNIAISKLKIPSFDLTSTFLEIKKFTTTGYILRTDSPALRSSFYSTILNAMTEWKRKITT